MVNGLRGLSRALTSILKTALLRVGLRLILFLLSNLTARASSTMCAISGFRTRGNEDNASARGVHRVMPGFLATTQNAAKNPSSKLGRTRGRTRGADRKGRRVSSFKGIASNYRHPHDLPGKGRQWQRAEVQSPQSQPSGRICTPKKGTTEDEPTKVSLDLDDEKEVDLHEQTQRIREQIKMLGPFAWREYKDIDAGVKYK